MTCRVKRGAYCHMLSGGASAGGQVFLRSSVRFLGGAFCAMGFASFSTTRDGGGAMTSGADETGDKGEMRDAESRKRPRRRCGARRKRKRSGSPVRFGPISCGARRSHGRGARARRMIGTRGSRARGRWIGNSAGSVQTLQARGGRGVEPASRVRIIALSSVASSPVASAPDRLSTKRQASLP